MEQIEPKLLFGIIGNPISHSLSPILHDAGYRELGIEAEFIRIEADDFTQALDSARGKRVKGLAVTAPFKVDAVSACRWLDSSSAATNAVNTLVFSESINGYNTDVDGIVGVLSGIEKPNYNPRIAIVGAGGSARAAVAAMLRQPIQEITILARDVESAQKRLGSMVANFAKKISIIGLDQFDAMRAVKRAGIIINATPVGRDDDESPIKTSLLSHEQIVIDLVYKKGDTPLIAAAKEEGCVAISGERVLLKQALRQFELFTGQKAPEKAMERAMNEELGLAFEEPEQ